jgi:hypothetical protein
MHALRHRPAPPRRLAWLLWFALLVPVAQFAAAAHPLSHAAAEARGDADGKRSLHQTHCDLCLVAAAIGGAAPAGEPPAPGVLAPRHAAPTLAPVAVWLARPALAYLSRAPPRSPR